MMKNFLFLFAMAAFSTSCSNSAKFGSNKESKIEFEIDCCLTYTYENEKYIYAYADITPRNGEEEYYYYYWIMDGKQLCYNCDLDEKVSYGEHFLELVLIDRFGDTLSDGGIIQLDEPLKITLLSPVDKYEAAKTDTIKFQYKISGVDTWEENPQTVVYVSTNEDVWEKGKPIQNNFLAPPLKERVYYWGVKAIIKQDTVFSEIKSDTTRSVWIKN